MPCPACGKPSVAWFTPYCSSVCKTSGAKQPEKRIATLYDFFNSDPIAKPRDGYNIAGFVSDKEFRYFESTNLLLPAVVNALQATNCNSVIYTNRREAMWVKDYPQIKVKFMDRLKNNEGDGAKEVTPKLLTEKKWPRQITATELAAPISGGGLYEAAARASLSDALADGSRGKGLARALRYYMLAAYSLLDISGQEGYQGLKNYVGALLVSDKGEILAAGINIGKFRHAEVSMLLSYFRKNPTATSIPENSIIFSTLTPCRGCTAYLTLAKSSNSVIYFGQKDTGKDGKVGEKISSQLSGKTKAPMGLGKEDPADSVEPGESGGEGVVSLCAASAIHKVQIDSGLASCMGEGSIATQIGKAKDSRNILNSASEALIHKMQKTRMGGGDESQIKQAVLVYIGQWLGTSKSVE